MIEEIIALLTDEKFRSWVLSPDQLHGENWQEIASNCTQQEESVDKAQRILRAIICEYDDYLPEPKMINSAVRKILSAKQMPQ